VHAALSQGVHARFGAHALHLKFKCRRLTPVCTRVARFFLVQETKNKNIYTKLTTKCTKRPLNTPNRLKTPNVRKIYTNLPFQGLKKPHQNLNFWYENKPCGNPGLHEQ
jgi:hypothetical protein